MHNCISKLGWHLVHIMACCLFSAKSLSESMIACWLKPWEQRPVKFDLKKNQKKKNPGINTWPWWCIYSSVKLVSVGSGDVLLPAQCNKLPIHWSNAAFIVKLTLRNNLQWNLNWINIFFCKLNVFLKVTWKFKTYYSGLRVMAINQDGCATTISWIK